MNAHGNKNGQITFIHNNLVKLTDLMLMKDKTQTGPSVLLKYKNWVNESVGLEVRMVLTLGVDYREGYKGVSGLLEMSSVLIGYCVYRGCVYIWKNPSSPNRMSVAP